ncbi:SAV_2336 N-terminal domain-related protein [Streptomyces albicerus]|uniref:SAV_2336 N-terminal domain-related protein n=1 Tax=Streptomyces albicerus TaxID=2569859 RepID=UPI00124B22E1|nr:SAV_2336 N-terminal domain-related protein [Streptomyces albicerus]
MARGGERLAEALRVLGACGQDLDADQVLDVLWLARRLPASAAAPLHRGLRTAPPPAARPPEPEPDEQSRQPPAPEPDDQDLPDLTAPSLYAAARQAPAPEVRLRPPAQEPRPALPVRVPEGKALGDELELGRALRPLRRRRASRHHLEIDEERTAAQLAESRLPDVVQRPVQERWLNLVLLVDDGLSMLLWHRLGAELRTLLERLGAFATTRVLGLDTRTAHEPRLHARPFQQGSTPVPTSTVNDPSGRTLVLVVSDGMGAAWRHGTMHGLLSAWAARGPVALLHTLPPQMWEASGIHAERWQATTRRIGGANTSWEITDRVLPPDLAEFDGIPVPVLEPTAAALRDWSHLLASPGTTVELPLLALPSQHAAVASSRDLYSAQHFRDAATPEAYRLAAHLAAVSPLSVPVMRLVQSAVPWPARTSHLAEVFLGGLIRPYPAPVPGPLPAKHLVFDFPDETKSVLLDAVPQSELLRTGRSIGRRLEQLAGNSPDFPAWLAHPDGSAQLLGSHRPFTNVERRLLTRFGVSVEGTRGQQPFERARTAVEADDWAPLTDDDPRRLGPYDLRGRRRGRRTVVYRGVNRRGVEAVLRVPRPDLPVVNARLITAEAEALTRLSGRYAPALLRSRLNDDPPWLAMAPVADDDAPDAQPPRLADIIGRAYQEGVAPFDKLAGLLVAWHLASALNLCHLTGLVLADFTADSVFVLRRTVVLADLSDSVIDGRYLGTGPVPTVEDNVRSLGELLQLISTKPGSVMPGLPEGMHQWQGDTWEQLRQLVLRCLDPDPARRPSAGEVAEILARYIALARASRDGTEPLAPAESAVSATRAPLALPPASERPRPGDRALRLSRFGPARREDEARLARLRVPLRQSRRVTLIGAYHYSGRATTTMVLGSLLATVRGEPVLALDGAAADGALDAFLTDRNPATVRDLAALALGLPYGDIRARTTRLPSGLEVAAHRRGHRSPNPAHGQEYARVLTQTAPHYSVVLTDWSPLGLGSAAEVVLNLTDRLVLCCGSAEWFLDAAVHTLDGVRDAGHRQLADDAIVVVGEIEGSVSRPLPPDFARRLGIDAARLVRVPFDLSLRSPGFRELGRLRAATTRAFLDLAGLVVGDGTH